MYRIIGAGLAGCLIALELEAEGCQVELIGKATESSASEAAAGVFNPVTGRRLQRTWLAEELFAYLPGYYKALEERLQARFFYPLPNARPLYTAEERADAERQAAKPSLSSFIKVVDHIPHLHHEPERATFGWFIVENAGFVEVQELCRAARAYFGKKCCFRDEWVEGSLTENGKWKMENESQSKIEHRASNIDFPLTIKTILCQGHLAVQNPLTQHLPLAPLKGEIIRVQPSIAETLPAVLNRNGYIAPRPDGTWWVGSTYEHQFDTVQPTAVGREALLEKANRIGKVEVEVVGHQAGIRPSVFDRRPLLGRLPDHPEVAVFNGLGTKGVSLGPYFAGHLVRHLLYNEPLMEEVRADRVVRPDVKTNAE